MEIKVTIPSQIIFGALAAIFLANCSPSVKVLSENQIQIEKRAESVKKYSLERAITRMNYTGSGIEILSQASFIGASKPPEELKKDYFNRQLIYFDEECAHFLQNAGYNNKDIDIIRNMLVTGDMLIANKPLLIKQNEEIKEPYGEYAWLGNDMFQHNVYKNSTELKSITFSNTPTINKQEDEQLVSFYIGSARIIISGEKPRYSLNVSARIAHEYEHHLQANSDDIDKYTNPVEAEFGAWRAAAKVCEAANWKGYEDNIVYTEENIFAFEPEKNTTITIYESDILKAAQLDIEKFYELATPLCSYREGWILTPKIIQKYQSTK